MVVIFRLCFSSPFILSLSLVRPNWLKGKHTFYTIKNCIFINSLRWITFFKYKIQQYLPNSGWFLPRKFINIWWLMDNDFCGDRSWKWKTFLCYFMWQQQNDTKIMWWDCAQYKQTNSFFYDCIGAAKAPSFLSTTKCQPIQMEHESQWQKNIYRLHFKHYVTSLVDFWINSFKVIR